MIAIATKLEMFAVRTRTDSAGHLATPAVPAARRRIAAGTVSE